MQLMSIQLFFFDFLCVLQTKLLNFSTNFLIYCSVSAPFKKALSKVKEKIAQDQK